METSALVKNMEKHNTDRKLKAGKILEVLFLVILCLYPMRHIMLGIDLRDTGYNYANHQYMGLLHMDSMWLFATYLANVAGHLFTCLPFGHTLIGMNFYTGLFPVFLGVTGYLFCTRKLHIPGWIAFLGEFLSLNLAWCPTAVLYNYLTYTLYFITILLLYQGLVKEKKKLLFLAGITLGSNILVRFSNLPEAGLILAVWCYAFFYEIENNKKNRRSFLGNVFQKLGQDTLWCFVGYITALAVWYIWIGIRYGMGNYIAGIQRLFAMTENATDYKPDSMLKDGMIRPFVDISYWVIRFGFFIAVAAVICFLGRMICKRLVQKKMAKAAKAVGFVTALGAGLMLTAMLVWLYRRSFSSFYYYSYDPIMRPATLFLLIALIICTVNVFRKNCPKEEKLLSVIVGIVVLLTSLGSNTGLMASFNFLFLPAPYVFWQLYLFLKWCIREKKVVSVAAGVWLLMGVTVLHCTVFGVGFVFAESSGVRFPDTKVASNPVLKGVYMKESRAAWMEEASDYVYGQKLNGREALIYGDIPGVSFYFQMPSCFNPWSDLASFGASQMELKMKELEEQIDSGKREKPVIVLEHIYHMMYLDRRDVLETEGENPEYLDFLEQNPKWEMIKSFMKKYHYGSDYSCVKLGIWLPDSPVISTAYADLDNDGSQELITIESLDLYQTTDNKEPYGNLLCVYQLNETGKEKRYEFDLSYVKPMFLQVGDINGDGKTEIGVVAYKTTEYHPVLAKRPFFYALTDGALEKVWLGSRLSRPFTDFVLCDLDGDAVEEIVSVENTKEGDFIIAMYKWKGFGFEVECQSDIIKSPVLFRGDRTHKLEKVEVEIQENIYTISLKENIIVLQ